MPLLKKKRTKRLRMLLQTLSQKKLFWQIFDLRQNN
jgi:hypothetical protein